MMTVTLNMLPNLFVSVFSSPQNYDDDTYYTPVLKELIH